MNRKFLKRQINNLIVVISLVLIVQLIKAININTGNRIIETIEKNIYYEFDMGEARDMAKEGFRRMGNLSKNTFEGFKETMEALGN